MNKKMKQLLLNGDCLKAGIARGDVVVIILPKENKKNDALMKQRSGILYGNTIFTDEQIIYFYKKHNGNASAASRELRMSLIGYKQRLAKLGLKPTGGNGENGRGWSAGNPKWSDKDIAAAIKKTKGNKKKAAKLIGCSYATITQRTA